MNSMGEFGMDRSAAGWGQIAGCSEVGNESADSVRCGEFLD